MSNGPDLDVGAYIRRERKAHRPKLTQEDVARMVREQIGGKYADFHRNTVSNLESGKTVEDGTTGVVLQVLGLPPLSKGRVYTGRTVLVRELVTQWYLAAPAERREHAVALLVEFIDTHPHGGDTGER